MESSDLSEKFKLYSDEELEVYISESIKYRIEFIEAAFTELERRGRYFSPELKAEIRLKKKKTEYGKHELRQENDQITSDPNAPELYSEKFVFVSSFLFSTIMGSILLGMNAARLNPNKNRNLIYIFGVGWVVFSALAINLIENNRTVSSISYVFNMGGAAILRYYFWPKHIPNETRYRKRNFWPPLLIGIAIASLILLIIFSAEQPY